VTDFEVANNKKHAAEIPVANRRRGERVWVISHDSMREITQIRRG